MTFTHKLAHRLALLRGRLVATALVGLVFLWVASCEKPINTAPNASVAQLVVSPKAATLQENQTQDFTAVALTAQGDSADATVTWSVTGGTIDTSSSGKRHVGHYQNANCGSFQVVATSHPGSKSDTASVTVLCPGPVAVASVSVTPASASVQAGASVQLTATPKDANGNPLSGRVITWSSSNTSVATVSSSGLVRGVAAGSATITATSEGQSGSSSITVTPPGANKFAIGDRVQTTDVTNVRATPALSGTLVGTQPLGALGTVVGGPVLDSTGDQMIRWQINFDQGPNGWVVESYLTKTVPVASVTVTPATATVAVGATVQLTATPKDANGNPLTGRAVTWSSSNTSVATVDGNGLVTGVTAGSATITATSEGQSGSAGITVSTVPVASVTVTPATANLQPGQTVQLTATPKDASGNPLTGRAVTWSSNNASVATVSSSGLVTAVAVGSATITATSEGQGGTAAVTIANVPVASVTVTPASASVNEGATVQLTATPKDANGNPLSGRVITWSSSNTSVATVTSSGLVRGVVAGAATITATSEGQSGSSAITVVHVPVASVSVGPASASVQVGGTIQLTATPKDANGNPLSGRTVTWMSNNTAVATVSASGLVSGVTVGSATITATSEGQSGTAAITVTATAPGLRFGHVFIVMEENTDYVDVTSSSMPYLTGLAAQYGLATQYYANTHPSIGNYFELATGQVLTNDDGSSTIENVPNIVRSLLGAGKTWKSYAESIPNACYLGGDTGNYARKHNVFALLSDVANDPTGQACNIVPFTQFATDLANGTLPTFSNIVPDLCNDAHDCSLSTADNWLKTNIASLIASPVFQQDGLLIITFDESGGDNTLGGGRVYWAAISPKAKPGYQSATTYQHPSTLRLILKGLGITVFPGAAATAPDMDEFFTP
ncbi:MAG TPA: Ig-like domain-containing protein [Gemmatimonadales bacterium]|nr:Ig-like domain-containing protein [Gemmatimonadales bacterium]